MSSLSLTITIEPKEDTGLMGLYITYPKDQPKLSLKEMSHMFAGGISLCVKLCENEGEIKDYELMQMIINHLNDEFVSLNSFKDAELVDKRKL
jgi:hypothetical protein